MDLLSLGFVAVKLHDNKIDDTSLATKQLEEELDESKKNLSNNYRYVNCDKKCLNIITLDQIAWHDRTDDCWLTIYDYVYDCTNFIKKHPGGHDVLMEYAGRDATLAFVGSGHTNVAFKLLNNYLIGELPIKERLYRKPGGIQIVTLH